MVRLDARTELVIAADIAERLSISRARVSVLANSSGFPRPVGRLGRSDVWRWSSVERWARETRNVVDELTYQIRSNMGPSALRTAMLDLLMKTDPKRLVLNLGLVPYMDSSGIAVLVEMLGRLRRAGGKVFLTNLQPRVKSILEIARLDTIFVVTADEVTALAR